MKNECNLTDLNWLLWLTSKILDGSGKYICTASFKTKEIIVGVQFIGYYKWLFPKIFQNYEIITNTKCNKQGLVMTVLKVCGKMYRQKHYSKCNTTISSNTY